MGLPLYFVKFPTRQPTGPRCQKLTEMNFIDAGQGTGLREVTILERLQPHRSRSGRRFQTAGAFETPLSRPLLQTPRAFDLPSLDQSMCRSPSISKALECGISF